jgi:hypothetical protein
MTIKLKNLSKNKTTKISEKEVKLNLREATVSKSIEELAKYEIAMLIERIAYLTKDLGIKPILKDIDIQFEKIE